jgi:drug/metabolite transporter (DMT)-like permease
MIETLIVAGMIAGACAANLLLKIGSATDLSRGLAAYLDWRILTGLALFALSAIFYLLLLRRVPLNVAQSFMALQFVGVILGSYFILHEPLSALRMVGVLFIAIGIVLVAVSHTAGR